MFALVLLLAPLIHSAPRPLHSHGPPPPCDTTICRVSDQTLDSALSTFLCFTEEKTSAMEEIDKKRELAAAIAPYLDGSREEELVTMGSESLVSLVNLVLHAGSDKVVKKTKRQHLKDLINNIASAGNFGLTPDIFKKVNPILLGLINCQTKTIAEIVELVSPTAGEDRASRKVLFNLNLERFMQAYLQKMSNIFNKVTTTTVSTTPKVTTTGTGSSTVTGSTGSTTGTVSTTEAATTVLPAVNKFQQAHNLFTNTDSDTSDGSDRGFG